RSTGRSCRRSCQKSCKASPAMPAGEVGTGGIPDRCTAIGAAAEGLVEHHDLQKLQKAAGAIAAASARSGSDPCALGLSSTDSAVEARRMEGQRQAHLPALRRGESEGPQRGAQEDGAQTADPADASDATG